MLKKGKFYIFRFGGRLVKFEALQVEGKLTSLNVSRENVSLCSGLPLLRFV